MFLRVLGPRVIGWLAGRACAPAEPWAGLLTGAGVHPPRALREPKESLSVAWREQKNMT